ncbi:MAG: amidohydrolase [Rhodoglobus sp.]|nr:amidohydrolase [Rhodoglobus sp.]
MRIVDAHHHLWDPRVREYPWMAGNEVLNRPRVVDDLRAAIAGTGVTGTVVVQAASTDEETDWLVELAESTPEIVGVVGWVALEAGGVGDRLAELVGRSGFVRGIRHPAQDEADHDWLARPSVVKGVRAVGDAGLVYDLLIKRPESAAAETLVRALPDVQFVVDHAAKPGIAEGEWEQWHTALAALAAHENVTCKVSGLVTEASHTGWREQGIPRYIEAVLELFGADRCMFGSDWPVSLLAATYGEVVDLARSATASLSEGERDAVFGGTAARAYGLGA